MRSASIRAENTEKEDHMAENSTKQMKGIACCADCAYYNLRKHRCTRGCKDAGAAQDHFYHDCPLPDAVPAKHGHWIMYAYDEAICSECNYDRGTPYETTKEAKEHWDELPMWCQGPHGLRRRLQVGQ